MEVPLAELTLRANPAYELVLLDRLDVAGRNLLNGDGELYGVLRPRRGAELSLRSVDADTALLFLTLAQPAALPEYVRARLGAGTDRAVLRLVVDGVLEIAHDGEFLSGALAAEMLLDGRAAGGLGRIGELSRAAARYGQELAVGGMPAQSLGLSLYAYGRRPVTAALVDRLGGEDAIEAHLGISPGARARRAVDAGWLPTPEPAGQRAYWRCWRARRSRAPHRVVGAGYKLYVSPAVDAVGAAVAAVAGTFATTRGVSAFKVGCDVRGLCRPDKLVVYFDRLEDLQEGAAKLRDELDGCPAHGVPFTAAVTSDGLLSWGADPPELDGVTTSWRLWVAQRLAEYLTHATSTALEPWQLALERLRLAGIDTDTWVPTSGMWKEALSSA